MSISEILSTGASVSVIGLGIVFAVLIILWGVLEAMRLIFDDSRKQKKAEKAPQSVAEAPAPAPAPQPAPVVVAAESEDEEVVAVIMAAIASSLNTSTYNLRIRSIKRTDGGWVKAARAEQNYN